MLNLSILIVSLLQSYVKVKTVLKENVMIIVLIYAIFCVSLNAAQLPPDNQTNTESCVEYQDNDYSIKFLRESGIDFSNFLVLDLGCGSGRLGRFVAAKAKRVIAIDLQEKVIQEATDMYFGVPNLKFIRADAKFFKPGRSFDLITSFFCMHWIDDIQSTFQTIYHNLKPEGIFLGTVMTDACDEPLALKALRTMDDWIKQKFPFLPDLHISTATGCHIRDLDLTIDMIKKIGFEVVSIEHKPVTITFKSREHINSNLRSIVIGIPLVQDMSSQHKEEFFELFVENFLRLLQCNDDGSYSCTDFDTVLYLRKGNFYLNNSLLGSFL